MFRRTSFVVGIGVFSLAVVFPLSIRLLPPPVSANADLAAVNEPTPLPFPAADTLVQNFGSNKTGKFAWLPVGVPAAVATWTKSH